MTEKKTFPQFTCWVFFHHTLVHHIQIIARHKRISLMEFDLYFTLPFHIFLYSISTFIYDPSCDSNLIFAVGYSWRHVILWFYHRSCTMHSTWFMMNLYNIYSCVGFVVILPYILFPYKSIILVLYGIE